MATEAGQASPGPVKEGERAGPLAGQPAQSKHDSNYRPDIQGLRALAVLLVVIYHLKPRLVSGGYVGVDVFFVISGYLITGQLANRLAQDGRVNLWEFWGRRARRLLPAAALVLLVTWIGSRLVLPATRLPATAAQIRASALYFQNWVLARNSTNYLTAEDAPTPVQHFWSLSVEEQFYLVWPLLFLLAAAVAWRWNRRAGRTAMIGLAGAVVVASLAFSAHETSADPAAAYFVTTTRIWELAAGGLLALSHGRVQRVVSRQGWLAWLGLVLTICSAFIFSSRSAFPGTIALLPVCGALLLLACGGPSARWGPARITSLRPAVFVGDISYSLYLWHWPLIRLWKSYSGPHIGYLDGPGLFVASIVFAWLTKRLVEDPIRRKRWIVASPGRSIATALIVLVPVGVVALYAGPPPYHLKLDPLHPGAAVLAGDATAVPGVPAEPPTVNAKFDLTDDNACQTPVLETQPRSCLAGDTRHPRLKVALLGDSVAGQWRKDLQLIARSEHWELRTELHAECPWTATMMQLRSTGSTYTSCHTWGALALADMLTNYRPNVVVISSRAVLGTPSHPHPDAVSYAQIAHGMVTYWRQLIAEGTRIVVLRETPEPGRDVPDCLSRPGNQPTDCVANARKAIAPNTPLVQATARMHDRTDLIDMDDLICTSLCRPIVGNVEVYRDKHHLTLTYTRTLLPYLRQRLLESNALRTGGG